ncbi:NAD(P)/FAD-dependent oxidoreductase [Nonomuraea cypriaca]|uniref:NAD(P)/FAD-dependent oxidoreductase n=1 Tax=Nonomuraea cypriaca TaxID=1187855 RepID=UPI001A9C5B3D|nr:FAD-binding oxidoreductase [Nonomuraea cypriaca]
MGDSRIVIVGGGIIGVSIAYHLAVLGHGDVVVLERGRLGEGTTARGTGGIRQQFSSRVNIELSRGSVEFFGRFEEATGQPLDFRRHGYLFLIDDEAAAAELSAAVALQNELGVPAELLAPEAVSGIFPEVRTDDLVAAAYCPTDGSASPQDAVRGFASAARRAGVTFREATEVRGLEKDADGGVTGVSLADGTTLGADAVVIATGPEAARARTVFGVDLAVSPRRRQAFAVGPMPWMNPSLPFTVDLASGGYFHPEFSGGIVGGTDRDVPPGFDTAVDWDRLEILIKALTKRIPAMGDSAVTRGWAGVREMTPDDHALVGPIGAVRGLWVAAGFSGHGFMHSPAIGESVAAWLLHGSPIIDLSALDPDRFSGGVPSEESFTF